MGLHVDDRELTFSHVATKNISASGTIHRTETEDFRLPNGQEVPNGILQSRMS